MIDQWTRFCILWRCVGWRALVTRSNYNTEDVLDVCAALMMRVCALEAADWRIW